MTTHTLSPYGYFRRRTLIQCLVASKYFWIPVLLVLFVYPIYRSMNRSLPPRPQPIMEAPKFEFTNSFGKSFGSEDLLGRVYIANFFYTQCPMSNCTQVMEKMQLIQKRVRGLGKAVALVSFTVDPIHDTPEVLHQYARDLQANPHIWKFLTGQKAQMKEVLSGGFKVPMGKREPISSPARGEEMYKIDHSSQVALVDEEGNVLGFYKLTDQSIDQLMIDVGLVVNRDKLYRE